MLSCAALQSPVLALTPSVRRCSRRRPGAVTKRFRGTISALKPIKRAQKELMQAVITGGLGPAMNTNRCYMGEAK